MHDCSIFFFVLIVFYSLTTFTLVKYSSTKIFLGGRLYKENNQKNCTIMHIYLILNTIEVMFGSIYFFGCFIIDDNFFFQDLSRSEFRRMLLVYDVICCCLFAPSVSVSVSVRVSVISSPASIVSTPGISSSVGLRVSLGVSLTLLAFILFFSRGNYGKSIAVKASVGMTINTCMIDMSGWVSIGDSGHGVGDSWCANSVSVGNSVVGIGESIGDRCHVRVDYLRGSQGRAGGQDGGVSFGITLASVVSVSISIRVSVPSISCGISLRGGLRRSKCQTGQ